MCGVYFFAVIHCQSYKRVGTYPVIVAKNVVHHFHSGLYFKKRLLGRVDPNGNNDFIKNAQSTKYYIFMTYGKRIERPGKDSDFFHLFFIKGSVLVYLFFLVGTYK
jgi:hypothetical protein